MKSTKITTLCAAAFASALSIGTAQALPVPLTANLTMYDGTGMVVVSDSTVTGYIDTSAGTFSLASTVPVLGLTWSAHDGTLYSPGNYVISTYDTFGNTCALNASVCAGDGDTDLFGPQNVNFSVPTGYLGGRIKFSWNDIDGIDVFLLWDADGNSMDIDNDGIPGMALVDGPFYAMTASFDITAVPLPAGAWLLGSGLVALVGTARRKIG